MHIIKTTSAFKKDIKRAKKRQYDMKILKSIVITLEQGKELPQKYRDHELIGNWNGYRECHIKPDWLLIYRIVDNYLILERTGTHSDLFKKEG